MGFNSFIIRTFAPDFQSPPRGFHFAKQIADAIEKSANKPASKTATSCNQTPPPSEGLGEAFPHSFKGIAYTSIIAEFEALAKGGD